ncbi:MAG: FGGY-family carbohydrate kinase, partial [Christensenella sp.]|uniref:FGGY-family carbohydrate kinase n=1 Tax=Christensenella sp. TaxID=1935934 RepID=UPI002B21D2F8
EKRMGYLMGIDIGSTTIKAVVYDDRGNHIASGSQQTPLTYDKKQPAWCVWEPQRIWDCVVYSIMEALSKLPDPHTVTALAVTGFGMDGLPLDAEGKPLYPIISWHCPRTIPQSEALSKKAGAKYIFEQTGKQVQSIDSVYRMMWMQENHPQIMEQTKTWLLIEDFVNFMLCGEMATDYSMATTTSVFDVKTHEWCKSLIDQAGVPDTIFPHPRQAGHVLAEVLPMVARQTGLSPQTKVVLGGHDYICGALAVGAIDEGVLMDITGTWEMVVQASAKADTSEQIFNSGFYIEGHVVPERYCYVGCTVSGDMTEWLKKNLAAEEKLIAETQGIGIWDAITQACGQSVAGSRGCIFLPHFSGAGTPYHDADSMGAFLGMHNQIRNQDMIRSVIEGLNYQFRMMVDAFAGNCLGEAQKIVAIGGATRNGFWMQNKADVVGCRLEVPAIYEATPLGAAMVAGMGTGVFKDAREAVEAVRKDVVVYEPDRAAHEIYEEYYQNIYCKLQFVLKDINREISKRVRQ